MIELVVTFAVNGYIMANDTEVILEALRKEREELHQKLMQLDRIIKRVISLDYSKDKVEPVKQLPNEPAKAPAANVLPSVSNIKIHLLRIFDILQSASKLKAIQIEYTKVTGNKYNIREAMRSLNKSGLIKTVRAKDLGRSFLWIKAEWLENGQLADKYKPDGFDLLYKVEDLVYE